MLSLSSQKLPMRPPSDTRRNSQKINYASENGLDDHMAMTTGPVVFSPTNIVNLLC